jgi:hypothetical protein
MSNLIEPKDGPRVKPLPPEGVSAEVQSEYDKTVRTWGIPNNLVRTMGCHPGLALTEVNYANSFIFEENNYVPWPRPGGPPSEMVPFPRSGFVGRISKELVINLVSLLNRSRYSITHHTVIGYTTLAATLPDRSPEDRAAWAEEMLLRLVDETGKPAFENRTFRDEPLFSELDVRILRLGVKLRGDPHDIGDWEFHDLRSLLRTEAQKRISASLLAQDSRTGEPQYVDAYVNAMLVELTWCIVHFAGLLNRWFTVLKVMDEIDVKRDGLDFVTHYNNTVPERIKVRNNALLSPDGWGGCS